jgi:broad specificity polyphosphatase/5'/3'-nucleotidase SurE
MRILIANDDGIYSPGIATLAEVVSISPTKKNWPTPSSHIHSINTSIDKFTCVRTLSSLDPTKL